MTYQNLDIVPEEAKTPVWANGKLVPWEEANMHMATHVINYGSGVFEGVRVYETPNGLSIFHLDDHLERLMQSCRFFNIDPGFTKEELKEACVSVAREAGIGGYIRPQIQFGLSMLSLGATSVVDATVLFWPLKKYRQTDTLRVVTSEIERISPKTGNIKAKVIGFYTNSHFNHEFAKEKGVDEAIMLDVNGNVAEASSSNVFYVKDGVLYTPEVGYILEGITRASMIELARAHDIEVVEKVVTPDDLRDADEAFLTGTAAEVDPVVEYDGQSLGDGNVGPLTAKLKEAYGDITHGKNDAYHHWHTFIDKK